MTNQTKRRLKRKVKRVKSGFGTTHLILILTISGFTFGCVKDMLRTVISISYFRNKYESALEERAVVLTELETLNLVRTKLNDPDYLASYIRSSLFYTKEGEVVFVIQGNK